MRFIWNTSRVSPVRGLWGGREKGPRMRFRSIYFYARRRDLGERAGNSADGTGQGGLKPDSVSPRGYSRPPLMILFSSHSIVPVRGKWFRWAARITPGKATRRDAANHSSGVSVLRGPLGADSPTPHPSGAHGKTETLRRSVRHQAIPMYGAAGAIFLGPKVGKPMWAALSKTLGRGPSLGTWQNAGPGTVFKGGPPNLVQALACPSRPDGTFWGRRVTLRNDVGQGPAQARFIEHYKRQ